MSFLKIVKVSDDLIDKGSSFHGFGSAAEKALSPYVFRDVFEMLKSLCEEERSEGESAGAKPFRPL